MEIEQTLDNKLLKLKIKGELDASSAINMDEVIKKAIADGHVNILIDSKDLAYISSAGLGVFVSNIETINGKKGRLVFYNMGETILNTFQVLGLDKLLHIVNSEKDAKKLFN